MFISCFHFGVVFIVIFRCTHFHFHHLSFKHSFHAHVLLHAFTHTKHCISVLRLLLPQFFSKALASCRPSPPCRRLCYRSLGSHKVLLFSKCSLSSTFLPHVSHQSTWHTWSNYMQKIRKRYAQCMHNVCSVCVHCICTLKVSYGKSYVFFRNISKSFTLATENLCPENTAILFARITWHFDKIPGGGKGTCQNCTLLHCPIGTSDKKKIQRCKDQEGWDKLLAKLSLWNRILNLKYQ